MHTIARLLKSMPISPQSIQSFDLRSTLASINHRSIYSSRNIYTKKCRKWRQNRECKKPCICFREEAEHVCRFDSWIRTLDANPGDDLTVRTSLIASTSTGYLLLSILQFLNPAGTIPVAATMSRGSGRQAVTPKTQESTSQHIAAARQ